MVAIIAEDTRSVRFEVLRKPLPQINIEETIRVEDDLCTPRVDKGKGKVVDAFTKDASVATSTHSDISTEIEVDWTKYEPAEALSNVPETASELIIEVVKSSIQNIKNQIIHEETAQKHREEEAERQKAEAESKQDNSEAADQQPLGEIPRDWPLPNTGAKASKSTERHRRIRPLARLLRHIHVSEKGESSAQGVRRSRFSTSSLDLTLPNSTRPNTLLFMLKKEKEKQLESPKETEAEETIECTACFEGIPITDAVRTVCHSYCAECFENLIATAIDNEAQWPPKCCLNKIPSKTISKHISKDLAKSYAAKATEFKVPISDRLYCPHPNCGLYIPTSTFSSRTARCSNGHQACTTCRQGAHGRGTCPRDEAELQLTEALASEEGWRRCIRCGVLIEHRDACQHMTCRCGASFCYVCGAPWRSCTCSMDDLNALKSRAQERRVVRDAEAEREERELQEALRQVEEFEREEARKMELVRLEMERLEELARAREMEERARAEKVRLRKVEEKYRSERAGLEELNTSQEKMMCEAHGRDKEGLQREAAESCDTMVRKNAEDKKASRAAMLLRIRDKELEWEHDYCVRVGLERALEDAYRSQLDGLWLKRKDREARVAAAMKAYLRHNDKRLDEYIKWRDGKLDAFRYRAEDQQAIHEELLDRQAQQEVELFKARKAAQEQKIAAELKWCELVVTERQRLLAEMEDVERECGGDADVDVDSWYSFSDCEGEQRPTARDHHGEGYKLETTTRQW